jgi:hypothetical protein
MLLTNGLGHMIFSQYVKTSHAIKKQSTLDHAYNSICLS